MLLILCLLTLGFVTVAHSGKIHDGHYTAESNSDRLFDELISRIKLLEKKDHAQQMEIEKLRDEHRTDIRLLQRDMARQAEHIAGLEATINRQNDEIRVLLKSLQDSSAVRELVTDGDSRANRTVVLKDNNVKSRIRQVGSAGDVAFFATLSTDLQHLGTKQAIAFDRVVTNIGNGYNRLVGEFTAPVAGTYVFSVTLMTDHHHNTHYILYKNSDLISVMYLNGADSLFSSTSNTAVLYLNKGDNVLVRHTDSDHTLNGDHCSMFSGFLLPQGYDETSSVVVGK